MIHIAIYMSKGFRKFSWKHEVKSKNVSFIQNCLPYIFVASYDQNRSDYYVIVSFKTYTGCAGKRRAVLENPEVHSFVY